MDVDAEIAVLDKQRKFLTRMGIGLTAVFAGILAGYVHHKGGIAEMLALPLNNMGDFLAGACSPLAFLWLVVGYRMQALELEQNSKALRQQAEEMRSAVEQAKEQAQAMRGHERIALQNLLLETRKQFEEDLALLAAHIAMKHSGTECDVYWGKLASGDKYIFCTYMCERIDSDMSEWGRYFTDPSAPEKQREIASLSNRYMFIFDKFTSLLKAIDGGSFISFYENSPYGRLNQALKSLSLKPEV
ncbi:hypothetical protein [Magnetospirillum moscoviense]|uniref:Uncharacterized protein n=1 Tax=Magnetospirillum moscoviense TaxID=1437059 RepID=A0A178MXI5_9PROT|nr:hypothetical protein [Magnetospirillum moscoviense]OAN56879.1 hypothetical protein A6A05_07870 [Magnetospirillum moscoviense]